MAHRFFRLLPADLHIFHLEGGFFVNPLNRFAFYHLKAGTQRLMTSYEPAERFFKPLPVELPFKQHSSRYVVAQLGSFQLVQDIETFLSGRERIILARFRSRNSCERADLQPLHSRGHFLNRRVAEYVAKREFNA
ncbi:hypothetical protein D1872_216300 [compost metagenome]